MREAPAAAPAPATPAPQPTRREPLSTSLQDDDLLQLLWYDADIVPRIRRHEAWSQLLEDLEDEPPDLDLDDAALDDNAMDIEDRRDTFEILSRAEPHTSGRLKELLARGVHRGRKLVPPLALFAGTLVFVFDQVEELKATVTTALPFASANEALGPAIEDANTFLATPHLLSAPDVARALTKRIAEAFHRLDRIVSPTHLEEQTRRALLENRHYQRRELLGQEHILALWQPPHNSRERVPTYLPASLSATLPMYERFRVRFIATVEPAASEFDAHPVALRVVALGRLTPSPY